MANMFQQALGDKESCVSILAITCLACVLIVGLVEVYISASGEWWQNWWERRLGDVGHIWVD